VAGPVGVGRSAIKGVCGCPCPTSAGDTHQKQRRHTHTFFQARDEASVARFFKKRKNFLEKKKELKKIILKTLAVFKAKKVFKIQNI